VHVGVDRLLGDLLGRREQRADVDVEAHVGEGADHDLLTTGLELRAEWQARSGLDARSYALVKLAALIALDAPPASYVWQVANALAAGATPADLVGVLIAVTPQVGGPRVVAAAPELMVALGLTLPDDM
jgi:alkylhydroperoxidase/carboxymuconolactone decarboxylase family protein YurZ